MSRSMRVVKCPSDTLSMTNRVVVNSEDWDIKQIPHLQAGLAGWHMAGNYKIGKSKKRHEDFLLLRHAPPPEI